MDTNTTNNNTADASSSDNNHNLEHVDVFNHESVNRIKIQDRHKHYYNSQDYNITKKSFTNSITIMSLNINSLRKNNANFITFLNTLCSPPEVIVLTEVRHNIDEILNYYYNGYNYEVQYPIDNRCGGVVILVKHGIRYELMKDYCITHSKVENLVIKINTAKGTTLVSSIYKHPQLNLNDFKRLMINHIRSIPAKYKLILTGDFNIDLSKINQVTQIRDYHDKICSLDCYQIIEAPTRITNLSKTLIDHFYIRCKSQLNIRRGIFLNQISDHLITFVTINTNLINSTRNRPTIRILSNRNIETFKNSLSELRHEFTITNYDCVDAKWKSFLDIIQNKFDESFPLKKISRSKYKNKLWVTVGIKKSSKIKEKYYKAWINNPTEFNKKRYITYKNIFNNVINKAKQMYFENIFKNDNRNKKTWSEIDKLTKKKNNNNSIPESINKNGVTINDPKVIADTFNEYFSTIGDKMGAKFNLNTNTNDNEFLNNLQTSIDKSILLSCASNDEINHIITKLSNKTSSGIDKISQKLIKYVGDEVCPTITELINLAIKNRKYPNCLKLAKIIPIFKDKDKLDCNNYRPISLLSVFNKIFERKLHNDLVNFIENNDILFINQFGFRKFHSTIDALIKTHDYIINERRNGKKIIGIFLDLSKAFDSIDNDILIKKIEKYGIRGPYNELIKSYLTDRQCLTQINDTYSSIRKIKYGVPQGSILGPLLFSLFINDIKSLADTDEINLFADDTNIFCTGDNYETLLEKCNVVLQKCHTWLNNNKLTLNVNKTHFVDFSKKRDFPSANKILKIDSKSLTEQNHTKYLGLILQQDLKWDMHIDYIIKKLNSKIPLYYQLRTILPYNKRIIVFNALSLSNILYGIELYAKRNNYKIQCLQKTQNRLLKILFNKRIRTGTNNLHKSLNILKVIDLAKLRSLLIGHKVIYENHKTNSSHVGMTLLNRTRVLRRNDNVNFTITAQHYDNQNKITENASIIWNDIPNELKILKCRDNFKLKVKSHLLYNY